MALKPKTGSLRIRIDPELLERFRVVCEGRGMTVSDGIRKFMEDRVGLAYQAAKRPQEGLEASDLIPSSSLVPKTAQDVSGKPEGSLARKRRMEKEAKALKMLKREERR